MDHFEIKGDDGYLKLTIKKVFGFPQEISPLGGYDTESEIEIKSQSYFVKGTLWTTTADIYNFYKKLQASQAQLNGTIEYNNNYERSLTFKLTYDQSGHVELRGEYCENPHLRTILTFEIKTDQSYLTKTLTDLKSIGDRYGDKTGVKNWSEHAR